ncbi:hypothetical protein H2201_002828 [Coniosporium apollinis]|uniref:Inner centromere protein ARK-binding domain-containing protein n=1 Tax=Coniosporium apollinis TaxID=61459 RepID=A0ABQ9NXB3_9PEZI|nr:hypothetical protein H2201_002828 [Coniosporium apollinis]
MYPDQPRTTLYSSLDGQGQARSDGGSNAHMSPKVNEGRTASPSAFAERLKQMRQSVRDLHTLTASERDVRANDMQSFSNHVQSNHQAVSRNRDIQLRELTLPNGQEDARSNTRLRRLPASRDPGRLNVNDTAEFIIPRSVPEESRLSFKSRLHDRAQETRLASHIGSMDPLSSSSSRSNNTQATHSALKRTSSKANLTATQPHRKRVQVFESSLHPKSNRSSTTISASVIDLTCSDDEAPMPKTPALRNDVPTSQARDGAFKSRQAAQTQKPTGAANALAADRGNSQKGSERSDSERLFGRGKGVEQNSSSIASSPKFQSVRRSIDDKRPVVKEPAKNNVDNEWVSDRWWHSPIEPSQQLRNSNGGDAALHGVIRSNGKKNESQEPGLQISDKRRAMRVLDPKDNVRDTDKRLQQEKGEARVNRTDARLRTVSDDRYSGDASIPTRKAGLGRTAGEPLGNQDCKPVVNPFYESDSSDDDAEAKPTTTSRGSMHVNGTSQRRILDLCTALLPDQDLKVAAEDLQPKVRVLDGKSSITDGNRSLVDDWLEHPNPMVIETSLATSVSSGSGLGFETPPSSFTSDGSCVPHTNARPIDAAAAPLATSGMQTPTGQPPSNGVDTELPSEALQDSPKGRRLPFDKTQTEKLKLMMEKGRARNRALTTAKKPTQEIQTWKRPSNGILDKLLQGKRPKQPAGTSLKAPIHIEIIDDPDEEEEEEEDDDDDYDTASEGLPAIDVKKSIAAGKDVLEAKVRTTNQHRQEGKSGTTDTKTTEPSAFSRAMGVLEPSEPSGAPQHAGDRAAKKADSKFVPLKRPSTKAAFEVQSGARAAARDLYVATSGPISIATNIESSAPKTDTALTSGSFNPSEVGFDTESPDHDSEEGEAACRTKEHEADLAAKNAAEKAEAARRAKLEENRKIQGTLKSQIQQALKRAEEKRQLEEAQKRADEERKKREEARKKADEEEKRIKREAKEAAQRRAENERAVAEREKRKEAEAAAKNSELAAKLRLIAQRNAERRAAEASKIEASKPESSCAPADRQDTASKADSTQCPITAGAQAAAGVVPPPSSLQAKGDGRPPSNLSDFRKRAPAVERPMGSGALPSVTISTEIREPPTAAQLRRKPKPLLTPKQRRQLEEERGKDGAAQNTQETPKRKHSKKEQVTSVEQVSRPSTPPAQEEAQAQEEEEEQPQAQIQKELSQEDFWVIHHRDSGKKWKDVLALWIENGGRSLTQNALQMRYRRAKDVLGEPHAPRHVPGQPRETLADIARTWKLPVTEKATATAPTAGSETTSNGVATNLNTFGQRPDNDGSAGPANDPNSSSTRLGSSTNTVSEKLGDLSLNQRNSSIADLTSQAYRTVPWAVPATRPTTGGKSYNVEAFKAYLASLEADDADSEQTDREPSPTTEEDAYHWRYHVKRKTWAEDEDEDDVEWFVVDGETSYSTLADAGRAAGREACRHRQGIGLRDVRSWSFELDDNDLPQYFGSCRDGHFRIVVDRFLCNASSGQLPESKVGWISKRGWEIMRQTTKIVKVAEDDLFDEHEEEETTEVEVVDGIYTVLDEANKVASKIVLAMTTTNSRRMDDQLKKIESEKTMREHLRMLEETEEAFYDKVVVSESVVVEIWVEEREIKGPRNI